MPVSPADVDWKPVRYLKTCNGGPVETHTYAYELMLPGFLAKWDVWDYWERERVVSMASLIQHGDVLFDIGAESGWLSVVYARYAGAENVVLVEPTAQFWPNIRRTWEKNGLARPRATYLGLFSDRTTSTAEAIAGARGWPKESDGDLVEAIKYTYIHEPHVVPEITLDDYVAATGIVPDALTMDTEGAEILVLRGATKTLSRHKPNVWVSIHPDLALENYKSPPGEVLCFMNSLGYEGFHMATDHEQHWLFRHRGRSRALTEAMWRRDGE